MGALASLDKLERRMFSALHRHVLVHLPRRYEASLEPVSLVMPLAAKDLAQAGATIAAMRRHLLHPIAEIVVPAQRSEKIAAFCADIGARYIDENTLLPAVIRDLDYVTDGHNRNGWMRQQILKLSADQYMTTRRAIIIDSDTRPVRPISYEAGQTPRLFVSDEFNPSYHACIVRLLGPVRLYRRSFVAHSMLFDREVLADIRAAIERHCGLPWYEAIVDRLDRREHAGFSEYELYGTYVYNFRPAQFHAAYWYNRKWKGDGAPDLDALPGSYRRANFLSSHVHEYGSKPKVGSS